MTGDLVPDPNVLHGTRPNQAYKDMITERIDQAYAENIISKDERDARAAVVLRDNRTTADLRYLTGDLPELAGKPTRLPAQMRVGLYILAGLVSLVVAIAGPVGIAGGKGASLGAAVAAIVVCLTGVAALIFIIVAAVHDKVLIKEYG